MYEIKNVSKEPIEIITTVHPNTPGCRIRPIDLPERRLEPGESEISLGYEPGVSIVIRPVADPARPRFAF